jgi:hypothetical protein
MPTRWAAESFAAVTTGLVAESLIVGLAAGRGTWQFAGSEGMVAYVVGGREVAAIAVTTAATMTVVSIPSHVISRLHALMCARQSRVLNWARQLRFLA